MISCKERIDSTIDEIGNFKEILPAMQNHRRTELSYFILGIVFSVQVWKFVTTSMWGWGSMYGRKGSGDTGADSWFASSVIMMFCIDLYWSTRGHIIVHKTKETL